MRRSSRKLSRAGAGIVILALAAWGALAYVRSPRLTPELRGQQLALDLGCFGCHGAGGGGGVANPESEEAEVPAWDGGTAMMYVKNEGEIREWILDGFPARLAGKYGGDRDGDSLPLRMPAYRDVVSKNDLDHLVAYYQAVANYPKVPAEAREGYRLAARLGCFGCHGAGGLVGANNPRAFKGYIPPWRGSDFQELVRNDDELRAWILDGAIDRLESNPIARLFVARQIVDMPAYRDVLGDGELDALVGYINWLSGADQ